jgi:CPA2 family monovalent cation:H+ antiporter-2
MLFDPMVLVRHPLQVLAVVAIIVVGKSLAAAAIVLLFRYPLHTALTVSASLAQIGEFSFILIALGASLNLMPPAAQSLVVAGALISIAINPFVFKLVRPLQDALLARSETARRLAARDDPLAELPMTTDQKFLSSQVVLVGYGRVGRRIAADLAAAGLPFVVAEQNRELVEQLRAGGVPAVFGDASNAEVLVQAHIARARVLVIATPDTLKVRQMVESARMLNPQIDVVVRSHNEAEARMLEAEHTGKVFVGELELADAMSRHVLARCGR